MPLTVSGAASETRNFSSITEQPVVGSVPAHPAPVAEEAPPYEAGGPHRRCFLASRAPSAIVPSPGHRLCCCQLCGQGHLLLCSQQECVLHIAKHYPKNMILTATAEHAVQCNLSAHCAIFFLINLMAT
jgi:hypothetical protein